MHTGNYFKLSSSNETIVLSFEGRQFPKLPSELDFAQSVPKRMRLSSLAYGIVCINKRVTYITNEVLTSRHDYVFDLFDIDLQLPKRLANSKLSTQSCSEHLYATIILVPPSIVLNKLIVCLNGISALVNYV